MTVSQYLQLARTHWILIGLCTALGLAVAGGVTLLQQPSYSATAQMFVTVNDASGSGISALTQGSTFTQQRVKSYADVIDSPDVLEPVINDLQLSETSTELARRVSADSPLDTVLLDVTAQDSSPARARDIANAVALRFTQYVGDLEVPTASSGSLVKITVTRPAVTPVTPDSPKVLLNLILGLLLGLALGFGVAALRHHLDHSIGTRHDPAEIAGAPVLAVVGEDVGVRDDPLIVSDPFSPRAEAFRTLRTNLRFLSVDSEVRSVVVTSSLPAEGKTTTAVNLALAIAQSGERVALIDADLRRPMVGDTLLLPSGIGLTSVLLGDAQPRDAVQRWGEDLDLWVMTSGPIPPNPSELIGSHRMVQIVQTLVNQGFMVIVDSPPLLPVTDGAILARITSGALVVTCPKTRVEQLAGASETLRNAGAPLLGILLNRVPKSNSPGYHSYGSTYAGYAPSATTSVASDAKHGVIAQGSHWGIPPGVSQATTGGRRRQGTTMITPDASGYGNLVITVSDGDG